MKNNWLGVLLGGFGAFCSSAAFSLGLGGITTESVLNEPLIAEIELINVGDLENTQILVGIGTESDYELAGVAREFFHNDLQFEVQVEGVGQPRIIVRTRAPLEDPYLNFMVQVRWPQGKLLREYTLLLDMPVFSRQDTSTSRPLENSAPTTAREAVAQQARQQQTSRQQTTTNTRTVPSRSSSNVSSGRNYQVASGDTLWGLAGDVSSNTGLSRHQAMLAIHEQNRDAFVNGDINRLKANSVLSIPSEAQMSERSQGQALRDFSSLAQQATATPIQSGSSSFRDSSNDDSTGLAGRLALSSSDEAGSTGPLSSTENQAAADNQQATSAALSESLAENAALKEQLDAAEIEKQELADRLANLEEQIQLMQEQAALEVQSEDLAVVQEAATAEPAVQEQQTTEPEPPAAAPEQETLVDKVMAFRYWILAGLALILVVALLVVLLVLRRKKSSDVEELYYEDEEYEDEAEDDVEEQLTDEDYEDEFDDEYLDEDEELDEGIDEITKELDSEEDQPEEDDADDQELEEEAEPLVAASFEEADEEDDSFESGEFEDLDEFFSDESADATNVLFGADDADEAAEESDSDSSTEDDTDAESKEDQDDTAEEDNLEDSALEFSADDLDMGSADEEKLFEHDEEDALEFEVGEMASSDGESSEDGEDEIDLENKFDFTESGITDDLAPEAAEEFEESIEIHSSDMGELLVPSDEDSESEDDELFVGETPDSSADDLDGELDGEMDEDFAEDLDDEEEPLLEDGEEEDSSGSILDMDEDLNLDEDMDADLGDLDLDGDDLDTEDADEEFLTKLELAEAYIEMGDLQGAKELLAEVEKDGNAEQKAAAKSLLENTKD